MQVVLLIDPLFAVLRRQLHLSHKDAELPGVLQRVTEISQKNPSAGAIVLRGYPELAPSLSQELVAKVAKQFATNFYEQPHNALQFARSLAQMAHGIQ